VAVAAAPALALFGWRTIMWGNEYWLSLTVFAAIVVFGVAYAVHRARLMNCCDLDRHGHQVGPRAR